MHTNEVHLATRIVTDFVRRNAVPPADVPKLIRAVRGALAEIEPRVLIPSSAAPVFEAKADLEQSIAIDYLVSFIDGKRYKTLKRHIKAHGYSPVTYRHAFGLPYDYPMICHSYSMLRSAISRRTWADGTRASRRMPTSDDPGPGSQMKADR